MLGGALWGVIWIPLRALEDAGLPGAWAGMVIYVGTLVLLGPLVLVRGRAFLAGLRKLGLGGMGLGAAFGLYATSLTLTDVVHAILLFYLTPVWGTLLGIAVLGERLTLPRLIALALGLVGLMVVLGGGPGLPWPRNWGDWMALASGLCWALGSLGTYRAGGVPLSAQMVAFLTGALLVGAATLILGGATMGGATAPEGLLRVAPWGLALGLYVAPMLLLTLWPATRLTPGRVGLLLMTEVIAAVASAAWLAGEPFGLREGVGSALMIAAAGVELFARRTT